VAEKCGKLFGKIFGSLRNVSYLWYVIKNEYMSQPLINRMETVRINEILSYSHTYPHSGQYLMDTLMETKNWLELQYDVICLLNDVFNCGYRPSDISPLFESK